MLCYAAILMSVCAWGNETSDRAAVEKVAIAFNHPDQRAAVLAKDADLGRVARDADRQPWSEVSAPYFTSQSIRFVTPDVAVVDGRISQYGTMVARQTPAILVMRREAAGWKVVLLRGGP
jgi:hypothetical protein